MVSSLTDKKTKIMTAEERIKKAIEILDSVGNGNIDSKNLYDLRLHLSEAMLYHKEQLALSGVVVNEANPRSKEHKAKLLREIMQSDEELGLYSEVEFYCQRDIEGQSICDNQCEHCAEYYKPLEQ